VFRKHNPHGGATLHLDNNLLEEAIARYQTQGDAGSLGEVIRLVEPRALTLIRHYKTHYYRPENELVSDINFKLMRSVRRFDAAKGSAFSYVSAVILSSLQTAVTATRRSWQRHTELDETVTSKLVSNGNPNSQHAVDDLAHRIKSGVKTTLSDPHELEATRWLVDSFLAGAFELRRHECCDACTVVYGVGHDRARELFDLILLECRRLLYDDLPPRQLIAAARLVGTRSHWVARFQPLLSADEFTKLVNPRAWKRRFGVFTSAACPKKGSQTRKRRTRKSLYRRFTRRKGLNGGQSLRSG
jgi:hypothetical protein